MTDLEGSIVVVKRLATHEVWLMEPFSRGQAWMDLLLLANDSPRMLMVRGNPVHLDRGQLAWSQESLAGRWGWGVPKVNGFLRLLQDKGMLIIKPSRIVSVITVANYGAYQTQHSGTDTRTDGVADSGAEIGTDGGTGEGTDSGTDGGQNGEEGIGMGKGERARAREDSAAIPTEAEVLAFGAEWKGDMARGIPPGMPAEFCSRYWTYQEVHHGWLTLGGLLKDWRTDLTGWWRRDWRTFAPVGKKNGRGDLEDRIQELRTKAMRLKGTPEAKAVLDELRRLTAQRDGADE